MHEGLLGIGFDIRVGFSYTLGIVLEKKCGELHAAKDTFMSKLSKFRDDPTIRIFTGACPHDCHDGCSWQVAVDPATGRAVLLCALDNLGNGAAGTANECMNLMCGFDETTALTFGGIYP